MTNKLIAPDRPETSKSAPDRHSLLSAYLGVSLLSALFFQGTVALSQTAGTQLHAGDIVYADSGNGIDGGFVIKVDPTTHEQTVIVSGGNLQMPYGVVVDSNGQIVVSDSGRLIHIDPSTRTQTVIADSLLLVRIAYYDVLSAAEQVVVEEASVKLLTQELDDQTRRYQAGTVPRFNVLRAEVELANERPRLIQARNAYRIAKNNLVNLLGYHVPPNVLEDVPVELTDKLDAEPYKVELPMAIARAFESRSELAALRKQESLRKEGLTTAEGGYKPTVQLFGGYGGRNTTFNNDLSRVVQGAFGGAQLSWSIFDGLLTKGKVDQARALHEGAKVDVQNEMRNVELEVRTDYSNFIEASETLESQKKVQEEAEEALRLATARNEAGTGTQLDVLSAQTSLTQARSTQVQALHDYDVARARLERAMGINIMQTMGK